MSGSEELCLCGKPACPCYERTSQLKKPRKAKPRKPARNDDEWEWEEDSAPEIGSGSADAAAGESDLANLLLNLISETAQLKVLLKETDEEGFRAVQARLSAFLKQVKGLPKKPGVRKRIGFEAPTDSPTK